MTQQAGHITKAYDVELERLHSELIDMVQAVRRQASDLTGALSGLNAPAAEAVVAHDASINEREVALDAFLEALISRRQPQAGDLRMMLGACRMTGDLERMGDEVRSAARGVRNLAGTTVPEDLVRELAGLSEKDEGLADDMAAVVRSLDPRAARTLVGARRVVSSRMNGVLGDIVARMRSGEIGVDAGLEFVRICHALGRVAAHVQNVGEAVVFIAEGLDIRHDRLSV